MLQRRPIIIAMMVLALSGSTVQAQPDTKPSPMIAVEQPWARATPGGARLGAGYLVIRNTGDKPDRLIAATAEPAARFSPHAMSMVDGVMQMRPLPSVVIPAHGSVAFRPGGDHLMFEDLKRSLKKGDSFAGSLDFETAGPIPVTFSVKGIGAQGPGAAAP